MSAPNQFGYIGTFNNLKGWIKTSEHTFISQCGTIYAERPTDQFPYVLVKFFARVTNYYHDDGVPAFYFSFFHEASDECAEAIWARLEENQDK